MNDTSKDWSHREDSRLPTSTNQFDPILRQLAQAPEKPLTQPLDRQALQARAIPSIDGYTILEEIGRGGMGAVYRARQTSTGRLVAIKVIAGRLGAHTEAVRRFEREVRILGRLEHHRIANVFAAGRTRDGEPFFAMELVEGIGLDKHLQTPVPLHQKLDLFRKIGEAVHHAHRFGVIHRDLKPGNILVCEEGNEVKVLDFGLARLTEPDPELGASLTREGAVQGTLAYMSPEQIAGASVTVASDVYSLGVLLYELVAGQRPYEVSPHDLREAIRVICDEVPKAPSRVLGRSQRPRRAGDLDTIVLRALEKDPARRHSSVDALLGDLQNYLESRPVDSRPIRSRVLHGIYRIGLFSRRHRTALGIAILVVLGVASSSLRLQVQQNIQQNAERGRQELLAGQPLRALIHLEKAALRGDTDPALRLQLGLALRQLQRPAYSVQETLGWPEQGSLSPEGDRWLAAGPDGKARLREVASSQVLKTLDSGCETLHLALISPEAMRLLTVCEEGTATLWDTNGGRLGQVTALTAKHWQEPRFSPNGQILAWSAFLRPAGDQTQLWSLDPVRRIRTLSGRLLAFSPDGRFGLTSTDETLCLQALDNGQAGWSAPVAFVRVASFDPTGTRLVLLGAGGAELRDALTGQFIAALGDEKTSMVRFSPDGQRIVSTSYTGAAQLWEGRDGRRLRVFPGLHSAGSSVDFSPDGTRVAIGGDQGVRILETSSGQLLQRLWFHGVPTVARFALDGQAVVTTYAGISRVWMLDQATGPRTLAGPLTGVRTLAFTPDGQRLLALDEHQGTLWRAKDGHPLGSGPESGPAAALLFRASSPNRGPQTLQAQQDQMRDWIHRHADFLVSMGWNPKILADQALHRRRLLESVALMSASQRVPRTDPRFQESAEPWLPEATRAAVLSPNQQRFAWMGSDTVISIRQADNWKTLAAFKTEAVDLEAAAYDPGGFLLAVGTPSGRVELWQADAGKLLASLEAHEGAVTAVTFSPDGKTLATAGQDAAVRLWSLQPETEAPRDLRQLLRCQDSWVRQGDLLVQVPPALPDCETNNPDGMFDL